jgi:hypothetical protein
MAIPKRTALLEYIKVDKAFTSYINQILGKIVSDMATDPRFKSGSNPLTRIQAEVERAATKSYLDQGFKDIQAQIKDGQKEAARVASQVMSRYEDERLSKIIKPKALRELAEREAERASLGIDAAMRRADSSYVPLSSRVYKTSVIARKGVNKIIDEGLIRGWSADRMAKELRGSIDPSTPGGVAYAAKRTARTEINNAFHASSVQRMKDSGLVDMVDWNKSTSHPENDECDTYADDGPYSVDEVPSKPHPLCLCFVTPNLDDDDLFLEKLFNGYYGDEPWIEDVEPEMIDKAVETAKKPVKNRTLTPVEMKKGMAAAEAERQRLKDEWTLTGVPIAQRRARFSYIKDGYVDINMYQRNPKGMIEEWGEDDDDGFIAQAAREGEALKEALKTRSLKNDVVVARGVAENANFKPGNFKVGDHFADAGFISTTTDLKQAELFTNGDGDQYDVSGWVLISKAPKGTPAIPGMESEQEIIFQPGQMQRIIGIDTEKRWIYTEMVK